MELEKITELHETISIAHANGLLKEGWVLLETHFVNNKVAFEKDEAEREYGAKDEVVYWNFMERRYLLGKPKK